MTSPPETLGSVRLLEQIGAGGMGEVWRGERTSAGGVRKRVAVKRILAQYARDAMLRERFLAEARITARLEHPNIVQLVDFGDAPELYLVLEYVEGTSLDAMMQSAARGEGALTLPAALYIIAEAAEGLDYAHRRTDDSGRPLGIVHRDVSPHNLLVSIDGAVKVSDFGIARAADNVYRTQAGLTVGKLAYMAPEQAFGRPLDKRADVFALGVVLWEAVTLRALLPRSPPEATIEALRRGSFPPPSTVARGVPPQLDPIVLEALAADPDRRTSSAAHLARALRTVLHGIAPGFSSADLARVVVQLTPDKRPSQPAGDATRAASPSARAAVAQRGGDVPPTPPSPALRAAAAGAAAAAQYAPQPQPAYSQPAQPQRQSLEPQQARPIHVSAPPAAAPGTRLAGSPSPPPGGGPGAAPRVSGVPSLPPTEVGSFPPGVMGAMGGAAPSASTSWMGAPGAPTLGRARAAAASKTSGARTAFTVLALVFAVLLVAAGAVAAYLWYTGALVVGAASSAPAPSGQPGASGTANNASTASGTAVPPGTIQGQLPQLVDSVRATLTDLLLASARSCALQNGGPLPAGASVTFSAVYQPTGLPSDLRVQLSGAAEREAVLVECIGQAMRQVPVPPTGTGSSVTGLVVNP